MACLYRHILLYLVSFSYVFELGDSQPAAFTSGQLPRRHSQRQRRHVEKESGNKRVVEGGAVKK